ncbi:MAG: 4Fe-4S binding protein [Clostridia bacterium]
MKAQVDTNICVACGCCTKVCRRNAIHIYKGVHAFVDVEKCTGCGLCQRECPASIITLVEGSALSNEKKVV